jgi:hypothetical protein
MTIINKGILDSEDLYERSLANDWPVAQGIFTAEVTESASNLYYTNARVQAYLDTQGVSGLDLSGNTTTDLAEGDNLYYTNSRVLSHLAISDVSVLDLTVAGNLFVQGSTTSLESTSLVIEDKNIVLANGAVNAAAADGAGITIDGADATFTYNSSSDKFVINKELVGNVTGQVSDISNHSVNALSDVDITGIQTDYTLIWNGTKFVASVGANVDIQSLLEGAVANLEIDISNINVDFASISGQVSTISNWTTSNLAEGVNLYYTNTRVASAIIPSLTTANVVETDNLYFTNARVKVYVDTLPIDLSGNTTTDLSEGNNLYYTNARVKVYVDTLPIDLSGNTTTDLSEGNNLYYTNARVQAYLDTQGISGGGGAGTGTDLSGNTTSDLAEGTNLYFTNDRVRAAFFSGAGISISPTGIISNDNAIGVYNTGIDISVPYIVTSNLSNAITFSSIESTNRFIVRSVHITNISDSLAYINSNIKYADSNSVTYANAIPLPVGSTLELLKNPEIFYPGDSINLQGLNSSLSPTSGKISSIITYQTIIDNSAFDRIGKKVTTANSNVELYYAETSATVFESVRIVNNEGNDVTARISWTDEGGNVKAYFGYNLPIAKNSVVEVLQRPKKIDLGDKIVARISGIITKDISIVLNGIGTSAFTYVAEQSNVNILRGSPPSITLETTLDDGSAVFYETISV